MPDDKKACASVAFVNALQVVLEMYDLEDIDTITVYELKRLLKHFELTP